MLGQLRSSTRNLSVLVLLTLVLQIGIIIELVSLETLVTRLVRRSRLTSTPTGTNAAIFFRPPVDPLVSFRSLFNENTLLNILEIRRPIGVFFVGSPAIPGSEPTFSEPFWSFGASHCASSEGFLATFTPRERIVIFCDYWFFSEDSRKGVHFDLPTKCSSRGFAILPGGQHANLDVENVRWQPPSDSFEPERLCGGSGESDVLQGIARSSDRVNLPIIGSLGESMRHNLMMTAPQGILEALIPTDEGRIGTGRNTRKGTCECS